MTARKRTAKKKAAVVRTPNPPVVIRVPRDDRLKTIHSLAETVAALARALNSGPSVNISHCFFQDIAPGPALHIDNSEPTTSEQRYTI